MPEVADSARWSMLWKVNQVLVPLLVIWGTWVTAEQYEDKAHREIAHATNPVETDEMTRIRLSLVRLEEGVAHLKADLADMKRSASAKRGL